MKKIFTLVAFAVTIFSFNGVFAQCTINTGNTTPGFTPATASVAQGATLSQTVEVYIPGTLSTFTIDSVVVNSISGLPTGINYTLNPVNGHILTSTTGGTGEGSICLSGSTSDTTGTYSFSFTGNVYTTGGTFTIATVNTLDPAFGFKLTVTAAVQQTEVCDTFADVSFTLDTPTYSFWDTPYVGYVSGNGALYQSGSYFTQVGTAEEFTGGVGDSVTAAGIFFGYTAIKTTDSADLVKVYLYDNTGTGGTPGNAFDSATISLKSIAAVASVYQSSGTAIPVTVQFGHNVALTAANFFVGVAFPQTSGDTVVVLTNTGNTAYGRGYLDVAGQWARYTQLVGGIDSLGDFMLVSLCGSTFPPVANFTQSVTTGCAPLAVTFTDASTNGTSYSWNFGDGSSASTSQNPSHTYTSGGNYTVTETVTNNSGSATFSSSVTVNGSPTATVTVKNATSGTSDNGDVVVTGHGGTGSYTYAWSGHSNTTDSLGGLGTGTYTVTVTDANHCTATASGTVAVSGINTLGDNVTIKIYPNPTSDQLNFQWSLNSEADLIVYDVTGQLVKSFTVNGTAVNTLDIHELAAGTYVLLVTDRQTNAQRSVMFSKF